MIESNQLLSLSPLSHSLFLSLSLSPCQPPSLPPFALRAEVFEKCDRQYSRSDTLSKHMKIAHGKIVTQKTSCFTCPFAECSKTCFHATQLIAHLSEHKINVGRSTHTHTHTHTQLALHIIPTSTSDREFGVS